MKDFLLHKLTLRVVYILGAYATSKIVSELTSTSVQAFLTALAPKIGIQVSISVVNPVLLKASITGGLLVAGEFVYHFIHTKFILPHISTIAPILPPAPAAPKP